jgi:hypothetical protein
MLAAVVVTVVTGVDYVARAIRVRRIPARRVRLGRRREGRGRR